MNKKGKTEAYTKKRSRRTQRINKAFVGLTLDEIKTHKAAPKHKTTETLAKEHREKHRKAALANPHHVKTHGPAPTKTIAPTKPTMSKRRM
jgi:hypothetical protein